MGPVLLLLLLSSFLRGSGTSNTRDLGLGPIDAIVIIIEIACVWGLVRRGVLLFGGIVRVLQLRGGFTIQHAIVVVIIC